MDTIFIENLTYTGIHGVYKQEHHIPQRFNIWITMDVDTKKAGQSDDVEDTVDYKKLQEYIQAIIEGEHHCLVEKIADIIAEKILKDYRVRSCEVTIKKLDAFSVGTPGVTIRRKQKTLLLPKYDSWFTKNIIRELQENDVCTLPLLSEELCIKIQEEAVRFPFIEAEKVYGKNNVQQNFTYFREYPKDNFLWNIAYELEQYLHQETEGLPYQVFETPLTFTEVSSQIYEVGELGISFHKDESRFRNIIVICVIEGVSEFSAITQRGEITITGKRGDVIFMRAPGFMQTDIRPMHMVKNIISKRLSISFRQEV
jgi:dihydroneopterin aldolase